jgi:hypothetical protein
MAKLPDFGLPSPEQEGGGHLQHRDSDRDDPSFW